MISLSKVYIADDKDDYRLIVEMVFKHFIPDYTLRSFINGQALLDALPQLNERPDLIILDQHMPQLDGYSTLKALKKQNEYRSIPVVMMSQDASNSEIISFYEAGAATFLVKSIDLATLKETLLKACQYARET